MKYLIPLLLLTGCCYRVQDPCYGVQDPSELQFKDIVMVIDGFYAYCKGQVVAAAQGDEYEIHLDSDCDYKQAWINKKYLRKLGKRREDY